MVEVFDPKEANPDNLQTVSLTMGIGEQGGFVILTAADQWSRWITARVALSCEEARKLRDVLTELLDG